MQQFYLQSIHKEGVLEGVLEGVFLHIIMRRCGMVVRRHSAMCQVGQCTLSSSRPINLDQWKDCSHLSIGVVVIVDYEANELI